MKMRTLLICTVLPFLFSGCFKTRQEIAREKEEGEVRTNLQQNIVEYNQNLEKAQADIGRLQGRIEELEHVRKKEMSGLMSGRDSEQKTIEDLKAQVAALQQTQNTLFEEIKRLKEDNLAAASGRPSAPPPGAKKKGSAGASYESGVSAYKAKDYASAAANFQSYLEANPKSKRALDARFHLADSLFKQKDFERAVVEFGVVHEASPTSTLGRKSTLRIAQSFQSLGKVKDAKAFAQLLVQSSPNSAEAKAARKLLK